MEEDDDEEDVEDFDGVLGVLLSEGLDSEDFDSEASVEDDFDEPVRPLAEADDERESVMYQPLPLNTMPTG